MAPKWEPFSDTAYKVHTIDPLNINFKESIDIGKLFLAAFEQDDFYRYRSGPKYHYGPDIEPTEEGEKAYQRLLMTRARGFHLEQMKPIKFAEVVYDGDVLVAFSSWNLSQGMRCWGIERLGRSRVAFWFLTLKNRIITYYHRFMERISYLGTEHPIANERSKKYFQQEGEAEMEAFKNANDEYLSQLTYEQLKTAQYPRDRQLRLDFLMIHPKYQRQGLGAKLIDRDLKILPNIDEVFEHDGKRSIGPQHLGLRGTVAGTGLYKKLGFFVKPFPFRFQDDGYDITITHMEKLRVID